MWSLLCAILVLFCLHPNRCSAQNLLPLIPQIGGTFCKYLASKSQIHHKTPCPNPTCHWDSWNDARTSSFKKESKDGVGAKQRIVLSYGHNGFGNQLWQHTVAFMIAEQLKARLFVGIIPDNLCFDGYTPPNTFNGINAMERLLPVAFQYDHLPANSSVRKLCEPEKFFLSDRPRDWRNANYSRDFKQNVLDIVSDAAPRCIKMLGYFQNMPMCADDARALWTTRMFANFTVLPGPNDISIYLRCQPRHYHFNSKHYYETILNHTKFERVWLFQAPECPTKLDENPSKDGLVASVVRLLVEKFNATKWPAAPKGADDTTHLLHDLAGLAQSKKLIIPVSSWAFWSGLFSNATEIHVNAPPHHPLMADMAHYIYHSEKSKKYFGRYNNVTHDIYYDIEEGEYGGADKGSVAVGKDGKKAPPATTGAVRPLPPKSSTHNASTSTTYLGPPMSAHTPRASSPMSSSLANSTMWDFKLPSFADMNLTHLVSAIGSVGQKIIGAETITKMQGLLQGAQ